MKFNEIKETDVVYPGEYVLYSPANQIALCGSFNRDTDKIRALINGRLIEDKIGAFQKIKVGPNTKMSSRGCSGCKSKR